MQSVTKPFAGSQLQLHSSGVPAASRQAVQVHAAAGRATQKLKKGQKPAPRRPKPQTGTVRIGGGRIGGGTVKIGTQARKLMSIANNSKEAQFRQRKDEPSTPKLLARVEQLRLLSKLEDLKLLSLLQNNGITLTFIEESGLLEAAESLGLLSAAADRNTPNLLFTAAFALYALAPAAVYFLPDNTTALIAAQAAVVAIGALGGTAAFAGGLLLATLQKDVA